MSDGFDVIVIGTGAGGGTVAHTLAQTGKRILLLERGDYLTKELENWEAEPVFVDGRYISADTWYDGDGHTVPAASALLRGRRNQDVWRCPLPAPP